MKSVFSCIIPYTIKQTSTSSFFCCFTNSWKLKLFF
nr:MAG TPA: hypothetical protein [Caudoviricetes sp.]